MASDSSPFEPAKSITEITPSQPFAVPPKSAAVSISANPSLNKLSRAVSSLLKIGVSATVHLRSGSNQEIHSHIAHLNELGIVDSVILTLRGDKPAGEL
jgi:5,10-methylenetetrahydrofolate reductase